MSQIRQIKEAADIVAVIGERLNLSRSGAYYRGLCPFHSERSPSFFVNQTMQRYKCFGCGETGDVYTFLEKYDGMSFYEALKYLADEQGVQLETFHKTSDDSERDEILAALSLAKEYYHFLLTEHKAGEPGRVVLKGRGISKDSIKLFQLGYALPAWDGLLTFMNGKKKYSMVVLEKAGLILKGNSGRYYDRFRGRIMFPLRNHRGQIVGFSGRVLEKSEKEAKYINSPETMVYHKSKMLYGLSELYQQIRKAGHIVIVEGEFDVISSAQAHVDTVAAIKGSALTTDHAKLLGRTVQTVLLALDTDAAGVAATKKAIITLRETTLDLKVVVLPKGKDPDDLARSDPKLWRESVNSAIPAYEFVIRATCKQFDQKTGDGKRKIMAELAPLLSGIPHAVEQEHYIREVAELLGVKQDSVRADMEKFKHGKQFGQSTNQKIAEPESKPISKATRRQVLEQLCVFLLLHLSGTSFATWSAKLSTVQFSTPGIADLVKQLKQNSSDFDLAAFNRSLADDQQLLLFEITTDPQHIVLKEAPKGFHPEPELASSFAELQQEIRKIEVQELTRELTELDTNSQKTPEQEARQEELLRKIVQLQQG